MTIESMGGDVSAPCFPLHVFRSIFSGPAASPSTLTPRPPKPFGPSVPSNHGDRLSSSR